MKTVINQTADRGESCTDSVETVCWRVGSWARTLCLGLLLVAGFAVEVRAQLTALNAISFNGTGFVNTTWLNNAAASGNYTFVYQSQGSNSWAISSQSGTLPAGFVSPPPSATFSTADTLVIANNRFYIRRTAISGSCAGWSWSDRIYTGPLTNQAPVVTVFSLSSGSVQRGALATVAGTVTDADSNLTAMQIDHLPPGAGSWTLGTAGAGTAWTGAAVASRSLSKVFLLPTAGTWTFRVSGTDSSAAISAFTSGTITVADTPYYDPTNFHNGVMPVLVVAQGNGLFGVAGAFNIQATVIRVQTAAGVGLAGAPVQVTVTSGGGGLAATASGAGVPTLNLTTNASGLAEFFYRQPATPYATSALRAVSGMGLVQLASYSYTAADGAADADRDGLSDAAETVLGTSTQTTNPIEVDSAVIGFRIHAPQR